MCVLQPCKGSNTHPGSPRPPCTPTPTPHHYTHSPHATMDILLGIQTQHEVLLVTSRMLSRGISTMKADDNKVMVCNDHTALAFSGEPGDAVEFVDFIKANVQLYGFRNNTELNSNAIASYAREQLAQSLRTRKPYQVNILVGGNVDGEPLLYWIDYLGSKVKLPYAAHGYASYYVLSTLDRWWKPTLTLEQGVELAERCVNELQHRMPIDFKGCDVHVVSKDGVRLYEKDEQPPATSQPQAIST